MQFFETKIKVIEIRLIEDHFVKLRYRLKKCPQMSSKLWNEAKSVQSMANLNTSGEKIHQPLYMANSFRSVFLALNIELKKKTESKLKLSNCEIYLKRSLGLKSFPKESLDQCISWGLFCTSNLGLREST